jgi:uncharacterized protein (DUF779 family)
MLRLTGSKRGRDLVERAIASELSGAKMAKVDVMSDTEDGGMGTQSMGTQTPWIDRATYSRLKRGFNRRGYKPRYRRAYKRRRTTYRRRGYGRRSSGASTRNLNGGMGPIVITGRGGYWSDKFKAGAGAVYRGLSRALPQGTFSRLGGAAGGAMFGKYGNQIGQTAGQMVAGITGMGSYNVNRNSLLLPEGSPVPTFANMSQATVICHREYIKDIVGPANGALFSLDSFPINPGNPKTFPWLSQIAANYDQYAILGMIFEYKSTSSDSLNTGVLGLGTIVLGTDYDSADALYSSKIEMENSQFAITTKPPEDALHPIECDPSVGFNEIKYLRGISVPAGKDVRLYDHGNFQIATVGLPNNAGSIGELWVTYQVAFYKPQFLVQGQGSITDFFTLVAANIANATPLGTGVQQADVGSSIGGTTSSATYSFPSYIQSGRYLVVYTVKGSDAAINNNVVFASGVNCSLVALFANDTEAQLGGQSTPGAISNHIRNVFTINVTGSPASFSLSTSGSLPASVTAGDLMVTSINNQIVGV